jgi:uncharacterized membrane protein
LRGSARGAWENLVFTVSALAMVGTVAAFVVIAAAEVLKALRLPSWLLYGVLGTSGLLAGFLLWRMA